MLLMIAPKRKGDIMKKAVNLIVFALLFAGALQAKIKVNPGFRVGLNVARLELTEDGQEIDSSDALGLHIGGFAQLELMRNVFLQPELLYTQKGTGAYDEDKVTIDYIALPVLLKTSIRIPLSQPIVLQPLVAPEIAYAISATSTYNDEFYKYIHRVNAGFNFGADITYTDNYILGIRYYLGLTDLMNPNAKRPPISNTCWSISMGYLF